MCSYQKVLVTYQSLICLIGEFLKWGCDYFFFVFRFLATGDSYYTIGHSFRMGFSTVAKIVYEVCEAICNRMQDSYMPEPTEEIWRNSAEKYETMWGFPNCIGSIDEKHVTIKCPNKSGSNYFCYLKKFSIVLMAIVGADYRFICVDIGAYGKNSDSGIFDASNIGKRFETGTMNVPNAKNLPGQQDLCPYVLIGDEGFALKTYLMRPFPYRQSRRDIQKENYNTRLCKARRIVENSFGILAQKWRIFYRPIELSVENTILIVRTACILHNFLRTKKCDNQYFQLLEPPDSTLDAFQDINNDMRRATNSAFEVREKFVRYFNNL